jgi:site-specific recombinase XerD
MASTPTSPLAADADAAAAAATEIHRAEFDRLYDTHLRHLRLKGLRPKTIEAYSRGVRRMGEYFDHRIDALSSDELSRYFSDLLQTHSWSSVKLDLYGYKFYTEHVLGKPWVSPKLVKAPKVQRLPDIVTVEEAARLFAATRCLSYRVFFFTLYSMGLRLGEGLALRVGDIDAARMRVHVRDAKGRRDRLVPLPTASLAVLRRFWAVHRHPELLFPARAGGAGAAHQARDPLDRGGVQRALAQVVADIGLKKTSTPTAFATAMQPT